MRKRPVALAGVVLTVLATLTAAIRRRRAAPVGRPGGPGPPPAGVREPRRPLQPAGSGSVALGEPGTGG